MVKQGAKGELPEKVATAQINNLEQEILIEKEKLTHIVPREVNVHSLLTAAYVFLEHAADLWKESDFEARLKLQKMIFTKKISY